MLTLQVTHTPKWNRQTDGQGHYCLLPCRGHKRLYLRSLFKEADTGLIWLPIFVPVCFLWFPRSGFQRFSKNTLQRIFVKDYCVVHSSWLASAVAAVWSLKAACKSFTIHASQVLQLYFNEWPWNRFAQCFILLDNLILENVLYQFVCKNKHLDAKLVLQI